MNHWRLFAFIALAATIRLAPAAPAPAPAPSAKKEAFNLDERKRQQAWLWEAPRRQKIPAVKDTRWPLAPEDRFILQKLEQAGLSPAARADDRTWLRRVHFVITGLPPSLEEIKAFLSDAKPGSRERAVDRLLASPHYGERWARHWMDLMRYAESRGHEGDYIIANAWHYRDYLIRAFNEDVPYDRFLMEHLAGDLLPKPRLRPGTDINESVLATGWAFLGEENHSPVDIRLDECERIDNKVDVFSKTFLGLTISCARCHDHKFDPIRAQDYYAMSGFFLGSSFRQVRFEAMENNRAMAAELSELRERFTPKLARAVASANERGIGQVADYVLAAQGRSGKSSLVQARVELWSSQLREAETNATHPLHSFLSSSRRAEAQTSSVRLDQSLVTSAATEKVIADFTRPNQQPWKVDGEAFGSGPLAVGDIILGNNPTNPIARVMPYAAARRDLFWAGLKTAAGNENDSGRLGATARSGQMLRTPTVMLGVGKLHYLIRGKTRVYASVDSHLMNDGPLHGRLAQGFDGSLGAPRWVTHDLTPYSGHRVHVEFGPDGANELEVLAVVEAAEQPKWLPHGSRRGHEAEIAGNSDESASSRRRLPAASTAEDLQRALVSANKALSRGVFTDASEAALANWLVQNPRLFRDESDPKTVRLAQEFLAAKSNIASRVRWESRTAIALFDGTGVDENVLLRGKPFKPGELSPRSLPVAFAAAKPITTSATSGRYELAKQLVDPSNPLVARTIVNRVWHHVFGRGIVPTVDNFGALGERPTHPELLDHLAWQFMHEDDWSLKRLLKRLVLTQTFAMNSRAVDTHAEELDPSNALLHRMTVRRLEGEVIRDALLKVSGRFNPQVGGPPITVHLTEFLVGRGRPDKSGPLDGGGRRSIYTAMRRNFLPTLMQTFDMPTPFSTVGKRNVTNVPAQSLALMNDALFHQQARVWAERLLREQPKADAAARVRWLFESAYGRLPNDGEISACVESLGEFRALQSGEAQEVDAWTDLCHALLNANDFIYVK
jgi:hypothetical protein